MPNHRVVVAMSGGVDSSVAAVLLKEQGYDVIGVTMRLFPYDDLESVTSYNKGCCTPEDVEDARRVCQTIGVPHYLMNFERQFQEHVIDYFCQEYARGRTPHPCLACNDMIKFRFLLQRALAMDADYIATGHYARLRRHDGQYHLLTGADSSKDQSYVLFTLRQQELERTLLPVGWYTKAEIRDLARNAGLPVADKPDSQEICFIPSGDYRQFIAERTTPTPGDIVDTNGSVLGRHGGIEGFTVGQRRGLGVTSDRPLFVLSVDANRHQIVVGPAEGLLQHTLWASQVNYPTCNPQGPVEVQAKVRYNARQMPATLYPSGDEAVIQFHESQRAITPGQAVAFYQGDELFGGGIIEGACDLPESAVPTHSPALAH